MFSKFLAVVAFCFILFNLSGAEFDIVSNDDHGLRQCADPTLATDLLCEFDIKVSGRFLHIITETVDCPKFGVQPDKITCIIVTNQMGDAGGEVKIVDGGINYFNVEIVLKSQISKGMDYHIEVYTNHI
ncbi:uncharacterized protein [Euwallacea fornicatus]|uniref:uncharacterized protein n=1 Tax=Euwallacea fornicatus TaxID=995702 RepID=UPI00338DF7C7